MPPNQLFRDSERGVTSELQAGDGSFGGENIYSYERRNEAAAIKV